MASAADPWWTEYFDEVFLRIYRPLLGQERTEAEVDAVEELTALQPGARVLDVGCGWGRHAIELARKGFEVTGLDLSAFLLGQAKELAEREELAVSWVQRDMRELSFTSEFEVVISLFSSMGYFETEEDDVKVLRGMRRAVVDGGHLVIETMHRDLIARDFLERDWWETPEGDHVWVERDFDGVDGISHELLRWIAPDGSSGEKPHSIRIRSATEWKVLLNRSGWTPVEWFGDWSLEPFSQRSERLIVLCVAS